MHLTFKYRLRPTERQHRFLEQVLEDQRQLYNAALFERRDCYRKTGKTPTYFQQSAALTTLRQEDPAFATIPTSLQRWTLKRLQDSYQRFFDRLDAKETAGQPRYRSIGRWRAFGFTQMKGISLETSRVRFKGCPGGVRIHYHRPLPDGAVPVSAVFRREPNGWHLCIQCRVTVPDQILPSEAALTISPEPGCLARLSTGQTLPAIRSSDAHVKALRRASRAARRRRAGSRRWRKARDRERRIRQRIHNARRTLLHQHAARIVRTFGALTLVAPAHQPGPRTPGAYVPFAELIDLIAYKAERAGRRLDRGASPNPTPVRPSRTKPDWGRNGSRGANNAASS